MIVATEVENYTLDQSYYGKTLAAQKTTVFSHDNKVAFVRSNQFSGINKHSGNRWWRWTTFSSKGFYRTHKGTVVPFSVSVDKKHIHNSLAFGNGVFNLLNLPAGNIKETFATEVYDKFNVRRVTDVYPMLAGFDCEFTRVPGELLSTLRATNGRDFTQMLFGKRNMRRDLVKATCSLPDLSLVSVARAFKNLVPVDWIIRFMRNQCENDGLVFINHPQLLKNLRPILYQIDPRSYRHLLNDTDVDMLRNISDICRFRNQINEPIYVRSFDELHRVLWGNRRTVNKLTRENRDIELLPLAKELDGLTVADLTIVPAHETNDLTKWGERMSNCISSYYHEAVNGHGIYAAVERDKKVIANLEIRDGELRQLLGRFNQHLDDTTRNNITAALASKGVDITGNWWGK